MGIIQNKIEEIRKMPEHVRIRYAWFLSISITILVIIVWMISLSVRQDEEITNQEIFTSDQMKSVEELKSSGKDIKNASEKLQESLKAKPTGQEEKSGLGENEGFGQ